MNCLLHAIATRSQPPAACPPTCPPAHPSALPRRVAELEGFIRRHQEHVTRLEQVLRLLSNDEVTPEEVEGLKEGMQYYLESSTEPGFEPDETLYDTLPLSDVSPPPPSCTAPWALQLLPQLWCRASGARAPQVFFRAVACLPTSRPPATSARRLMKISARSLPTCRGPSRVCLACWLPTHFLAPLLPHTRLPSVPYQQVCCPAASLCP